MPAYSIFYSYPNKMINSLYDMTKSQCFLEKIDTSLFNEMGVILISNRLNQILSNGETKKQVIFVDSKGKNYEAIVDSHESTIEGKDLSSLFSNEISNYYYFELVEQENSKYKVLPYKPAEITIEHLKFPNNQSEGFYLPVHNRDVDILNRLEQKNFEPFSVFRLNLSSHNLSICHGFDSLLAINHTKDIIMYDHQTNVVRTVLNKFRGRALLCDEVGLGKTIEAGMILLEYIVRKLVKRVLILTPPSLTTQWKEEMQRKFNLDFVVNDEDRFKSLGDSAWSSFTHIIASLHTAKMPQHRNAIEKVEYDMIIIDEAHHLRNKNTVAWKFVNSLKKKYILMLTATPVQNDLEELFNLISLLRPGQLKTLKSFSKEYISRGDRLKPKNIDQLRELLADVMIRNRRSTSNIRFTKRYATTFQLELTPQERTIYDELTNRIKKIYEENPEGNIMIIRTLQEELGSSTFAVYPTLLKLCDNKSIKLADRRALSKIADESKKITDNTKAKKLVELLTSNKEKFLVFTKFRATQDYLHKVLDDAGISNTLFNGEMRRIEKEESVEKFRKDTQVLISTESGGEGRNLQFCNMLVNYDLPWNPMKIEQRIGRISRVGQDRDVYIFNLSALGTIEDYMLYLLDAKINMFQLVVGEVDMILGNLQTDKQFDEIVLELWLKSKNEKQLKDSIEQLGEQLLDARNKYVKQKECDDALFADKFETIK